MTIENTDIPIILRDIDSTLGEKALLSVEDVMKLLGCTRVCVHNWMRRNELERRPPKLKVGRNILFPKTKFVEWLVKEQRRA